MASYKDITVNLGASDKAMVTVRSTMGEERTIGFGEDGAYRAYLVGADAEIPSHYHLEAELSGGVTIYDDEGPVFVTGECERVRIYRAGMRGCIIQEVRDAEDE